MSLTLEQIKAASLAMRPVTAIDLPLLSRATGIERLGIRALSGADMSDVFRHMGGTFDGLRFPSLVAGMSLVNADSGERIADIGTVDALKEAMTADESATLRAASDVINRLSYEAQEEAKKG